MPVVRSTVAALADIPAFLVTTLGDSVRRIVLRVPGESPDPTEILTYQEAVSAIVALDAACRRDGVCLQFADRQGPPPCAFPARGRPHHLYALNRGSGEEPGLRHLPGCATCVVRDRCPGVSDAYLARHPEMTVTPITDDRARRRLSMLDTVEKQIARELVQPSFPALGLEEALVRVNFHCNQACDFCFVSTHLPSAHVDVVQRAIEEAAAQGKRVILSGGEPTLNLRLAEYVSLAKERSQGRWPVEIQTNAVLLDDEKRVLALVRAGLDAAFVSLHGSTAEIGDAVTRAPGTFARTVVGVDNLVRAGVTVVINFVICTVNRDDLPGVVDLVGHRWPGVALNVSFIAPSTEVVPRESWLVPRYSDVLPRVEEARARAAALGVRLMGFESMCGIRSVCPARAGRVGRRARDSGRGTTVSSFEPTPAGTATSMEAAGESGGATRASTGRARCVPFAARIRRRRPSLSGRGGRASTDGSFPTSALAAQFAFPGRPRSRGDGTRPRCRVCAPPAARPPALGRTNAPAVIEEVRPPFPIEQLRRGRDSKPSRRPLLSPHRWSVAHLRLPLHLQRVPMQHWTGTTWTVPWTIATGRVAGRLTPSRQPWLPPSTGRSPRGGTTSSSSWRESSRPGERLGRGTSSGSRTSERSGGPSLWLRACSAIGPGV